MNFLDPLIFDTELEASRFARRHGCALCLGELRADGLQIVCENCGPMYQHTVASESTITITRNNQGIALVELRVASKPRRSEEEILSELGF